MYLLKHYIPIKESCINTVMEVLLCEVFQVFWNSPNLSSAVTAWRGTNLIFSLIKCWLFKETENKYCLYETENKYCLYDTENKETLKCTASVLCGWFS